MLTDDEIASLWGTKSEVDWDAACDSIKAAHGGGYPTDWWERVQTTGLASVIQLSWKHETPYLRAPCTLFPILRLAIMTAGESPCDGCNGNRAVCGGSPKVER